MKKLLSFITGIAFGASLVAGSIVFASGGNYNTYSSFFNRSDGALIPVNTGDSIGSSSQRISKIWTTDFDATTVAITGSVTGSVGLGSTTPWGVLSVESTANPIVVFGDAAQDDTPFMIDGSGNVGIGTSTPTSFVNVYDSAATTTQFSHSGSAGKGARFILEDTNGTTCTEIYTNNGAVESAVIACP